MKRDQHVFQRIGVRQDTAVGHDGHHALSLPVDPDDQMPDQALPGFFPIWFHVKRSHPGQEGFGNLIGRGHGIGTGCRRNYCVASRSIKTENGQIRAARAGERSFVSVSGRFFHPDDRRDFRFDAADPAKTILHLLPFGSQGGLITHMPAGTSAAAGICRAAGILPIGRRRGRRRFHAAEGVAFFGFDDPDGGFLAGKESGDEDREPFMTADSLQIRAEVIRGQGQTVVFLHPDLFPPH